MYDRFLVNASGVPLVSLSSADLYSAVTSTNVSFDGPTADSVTGAPLRVAAPPQWLPDTSLSHFYSIYNPDSLMIPGFPAGKRYPIDTRTTAVLQDLGWRMHNTVSVRPLAYAGLPGTTWFRMALNQPAAVPVVVNYHAADGTAKAGKDYTAVKGRITIPAGQQSVDIRVKTSTAYSSAGRTLSLVLDHSAAADLGAASSSTVKAVIGPFWAVFWG